MHGIIAMAEELSESSRLEEKEKETASIIRDCADHIVSLTNDILDFEKVRL